MRKIKFKRKSKKIFFSRRFFLLIFISIIILSSSAYAIFTERLTINGTVTGQIVYTYYFEKPSDWEVAYAYLWDNESNKFSDWPGTSMTSTGKTSNGNTVYKITISKDAPNYREYKNIIFSNGVTSPSDGNFAKKTADIPITISNNNMLYSLSSSSTIRISYYSSSFTDVYAYIWRNSDEAKYNNKIWPGTNITASKSGNIYYIDLPSNTIYDRIIFNNGSGGDTNQTKNLIIPKNSAIYNYNHDNTTKPNDFTWFYSEGSWSNYITYPTFSPSHTDSNHQ